MKIHIVTGHYTPQLAPRAFRASELAKEFKRRGHNVTVSNLNTIVDFDYEKYSRDTGIMMHNLGLYHSDSNKILQQQATSQNRIKKIINKLSIYFLDGRLLFQAPKIARRVNVEQNTELLIVLSTPFMDVLGISQLLENRHINNKMVVIADSGDPFYYSKQVKRAPWFYYIEKRAYKQYDYLTIPVESAIPSYEKLIPRDKIKIIPQGFNIENVNLYQGDFRNPIRMAYAGVFYWDIRNPEFLFDYMNKLDKDFEFHLYLRYADTKLLEVINKYRQLKNKLILNIGVNREELLYKLSSMHFLINIDNLSNTQIPSKLIDYAITKRPVFTCNEKTFSPEKLKRFLSGNYEGALEIDIAKHNIINIAQQFLDLKIQKTKMK